MHTIVYAWVYVIKYMGLYAVVLYTIIFTIWIFFLMYLPVAK